MSPASLDRYADDFERLRALPPDERDAALAALPLDADERAQLRRLLDADADADDPLARALGASAARLAELRSDRFGAYRLVRELGAGGMGTVFLAERVDGGFEQHIAIKLLRGFPTTEGLRRLRQERQILAGLDHPHIARLLDGGETADGQPWLALEYVDGLPLLDYAARHAPRLPERLALFDAILDAVGHAHQRLVIHRDIKPANVLVNAAGEVKLLDFGIARLVDLEGDPNASATSSTRLFSPGYASPEQRDGRAVTTASDIYGLGVLLRELVGGRARPVAGLPALPLDAELAGIVAKATDEEPARRYASAGEFRDELDRYRDGRPVRAARMTRGYRLRKFIGRHQLGTAAILLAVVASTLFVWRLEQARERAVAAEAMAEEARLASARDASSARAALAFLTDAFTQAAPENALSKTVGVRDLLDKATASLDNNPLDPVVEKSMHRLLGRLYDSLGDKQRAIERFHQGIDGVQPRDRAQALELAHDLDQYANLLGIVDRLADARAAIDRAAALRERFAPDDAQARALSLASLAIWHANAGEAAKSIPLFRQVLDLPAAGTELPADLEVRTAAFLSSQLSSSGSCAEALEVSARGLARIADGAEQSPPRLWLLRTRAAALRACGRPDEAEAVLRDLIAMHEQLVGKDSMAMLQLTNELSLALKAQGRFREAATLLQEVRIADDEGPHNRAVILANLATAFEEGGDYPRALQLIGQAAATLDRAGTDPDNDARRTIARIEARLLALSRRTTTAIETLEDLRSRARAIDGEDAQEYANATWQLAFAQHLAGNTESAASLAAETERIWTRLLPPQHRNFAQLHHFRATLALARGQLDGAERELALAREALQGIHAPPSDLAIIQGTQARIRLEQGRHDGARALLESALPRLRDSFLPAHVWRADAERTAARLGMR